MHKPFPCFDDPRSRRNRPRWILGRVIVYTILILGLVVTLIPFIWVILTSLKPASEIIKVPPTFLPEHWTLQSYIDHLHTTRACHWAVSS